MLLSVSFAIGWFDAHHKTFSFTSFLQLGSICLWIWRVRVSIYFRAAHFTLERLGVLRAVFHACALRAVCHACRAFKPILHRELSKFFSCRESSVSCERGLLHLERPHKDIPVHIIRTMYDKNSKFTQSVTMACSLCRVSRVACFQTFVLDREHSNLFFLVGSPLFLCGRGLLHLERHHKDIPGTNDTYHTRYVDTK